MAQSTAAQIALPGMRQFSGGQTNSPSQSNAQIAQDYMALNFQMESGTQLDVISRFETPITVALRGPVPATAAADLSRLISRLQSEAGINISQTSGPAVVTVEFLPRAKIKSAFSNVSCFVIPEVSSWAEYRQKRRSPDIEWSNLTTRTRAAIFIPADTSPQEIRDCLHEELAQALGPLNDLYALTDSVFNDDNFQTVLTGFDMLILRLHYAPQLHSGMNRGQVALLLPGLLAQLNPAGQFGGTTTSPTPRAWTDAIDKALTSQPSLLARRSAAQTALNIATSQGWHDSRLAFSYFMLGKLNLTETAPSALNAAAQIYQSLPNARIHAAHTDMQLAGYALSQADAAQAIAYADRAIPTAMAAENAALLSTLLMVKSEAFALQGQTAAAQSARLDSLAWARYGFGSEKVVRARMADIAAMVPDKPTQR